MRKMVGGGMRQAGVLAAAGIIALEQMIDRLQEDHDNARILAEGIAEIPGLSLDPQGVQTNIVFFDFVSRRMSAEQFVQALEEAGVGMLTLGPGRVRAVTHYGIERAHVQEALRTMRRAVTGQS
jgi:threonine aldolase